MNNPFESGHIKNYLLLYASVVVIMILFFIASQLFNDVENVEKKVFQTKAPEVSVQKEALDEEEASLKNRFKLMESSY